MSDWKPILEELERRRAIARALGGAERVERLMTQRGKLDAETQPRVEREQRAGQWRMAAGMGTDDVIDPRELRNAILSGLALAAGRLRGPTA